MSWYEELDKWATDYLPEMEYEKDAPLDRYTSFRIGGPARRMQEFIGGLQDLRR